MLKLWHEAPRFEMETQYTPPPKTPSPLHAPQRYNTATAPGPPPDPNDPPFAQMGTKTPSPSTGVAVGVDSLETPEETRQHATGRHTRAGGGVDVGYPNPDPNPDPDPGHGPGRGGGHGGSGRSGQQPGGSATDPIESTMQPNTPPPTIDPIAGLFGTRDPLMIHIERFYQSDIARFQKHRDVKSIKEQGSTYSHLCDARRFQNNHQIYLWI